MDIPLEIVIENIDDSFDTSRVYLFKNKDYAKEAPKHYHISIKIKDDNYILLTLITSQVEKKKRFYELSNPILLNGLVFLNDTINILDKKSCIDCNQPLFLTKEELSAKVDGNIEFIEVKIDNSLKENVIQAIKNSAMVREEIKELIL